MSDQSQTVGFKFIQNPQGQPLSGSGLLLSATAQQRERDVEQQQMYVGIALVAVLAIAAIFIWRRRSLR